MRLNKKERVVLLSALYQLCNLEMTEIDEEARKEYNIASNLIDKLELKDKK